MEYDFNTLSNVYHKKCLFPVLYTDKPIDLTAMIADFDDHKIYEYPADTLALCAALNKSSVWSYEKEWRMIFVNPFTEDLKLERVPYYIKINPKSVYLGYHFMKPFYYFDKKNEYDKAKENIKNFNILLNYLINEKIDTFIMNPNIGTFIQVPIKVDAFFLKRHINETFKNNKPVEKRYYVSNHIEFIEIIEKGV